MIIRFMLFEKLKSDKKVLNDACKINRFASCIATLYKAEDIYVQVIFNNFIDTIDLYEYRIVNFNTNEVYMVINYIKNNDHIIIDYYPRREINIKNYIKYVTSDINYSKIKISNLDKIKKELTIDNYLMWKDANKYNL